MEKIKKLKPPFNLESDFFLRILAIIVAVIIWVVLSITQYPTTTLKVSNVPVLFSLDGTVAQEKGLRAVGYEDITTTAEIKGMKYEIGGYTEKDLVASINLDDVAKEGTYSLPIVVKSAHSSDQCEVLSCYPNTVKITFEHYSEKRFDIEAEAPNVSAAEGLILKNSVVTPSQITVTGSDDNLEKISKVTAKVKEEKTLTEDTTISTSNIVFYDADNNKLSPDDYSVDNENFDVKFTLYKKKNVTLNVDFKNCPPGFNTSSLPYKLSTQKIELLSTDLDDSTTAVKTVGTIDLSKVNLKKSFTFDIPFDKNEENLSNVSTVDVTFDDSDYTSKSFSISKSDFTFTNKPSGKNAEIDTPSSIKVTMIGPNSVMEKLESDDLTAEIDLSDVSTTGSVTKNITVYSKKYNKIWCYGSYEAQVTISD